MIAFPCPECGDPIGTASSLAGKTTECPHCHKQVPVPTVADPKLMAAPVSACKKTGKIPPRLLWLAILCPPLAWLVMGDIFMAIGSAALLISTFGTAWIVVAPLTVLLFRRALRDIDTVALAEARRTSAPGQPPTSLSAQPALLPIENLHALGKDDVVIRVIWPGKCFLVDMKFNITFDGKEIATTSLSRPLDQEVRTTTGRHVLQVGGSMRCARQYVLDCSRPGFYLAQLAYSRAWGNFARQCPCRMIAVPSHL